MLKGGKQVCVKYLFLSTMSTANKIGFSCVGLDDFGLIQASGKPENYLDGLNATYVA
jgi:hypothetical protein